MPPKRPKKEYEEIKMRNIAGRLERPNWEEPQHRYQEEGKIKTYGL